MPWTISYKPNLPTALVKSWIKLNRGHDYQLLISRSSPFFISGCYLNNIISFNFQFEAFCYNHRGETIHEKIAFDSEKYLNLQRDHILGRINQARSKLATQGRRKNAGSFHAPRPTGLWATDNKIRFAQELKDQVEIVIAINANNIERSKARGDLGISYDQEGFCANRYL